MEQTDAAPLSEQEVRALHEALDEVRRACATASLVLRDHGPARAFSIILEGGARHLAALEVLFARYALPFPADRWVSGAPRFATLEDACRAALAAEEVNDERFERLLDSSRRADLLTLFRHLQSASRDRQVPALRRCAGEHAARRRNRCG